MKLFFYEPDDLHQFDFIDNQMMAKENEKLRGFPRTIYQQRQSWKHRALAAEAGLDEATAKISTLVAVSATLGTLPSSGILLTSP